MPKQHQSFEQITEERLTAWKERLKTENATPMIMISVGHQHNSGKIIVTVTENISDAGMLLFLQKTIQILQTKISKAN